MFGKYDFPSMNSETTLNTRKPENNMFYEPQSCIYFLLQRGGSKPVLLSGAASSDTDYDAEIGQRVTMGRNSLRDYIVVGKAFGTEQMKNLPKGSYRLSVMK